MEPLGANGNSQAEKLIDEEFIDGIKPGPNGTRKRTPAQIKKLESIKQKMREYYNWNEKSNFDLMAAQNCSDMIVEVGQLFLTF